MKANVIMGAVVAALVSCVGHGASAMDINLCTGSEDFPYHEAGKLIQQRASKTININLRTGTGGTWGNIERTVLGLADDPGEECQAMIGQPDGPAHLKRTNPSAANDLRKVADLHAEYLHVLCYADGDIDELEDFEDDPASRSLALGKNGSGAWLVWQNIIAEDDDYAGVDTRADGGLLALSAVATGDIDCMLVPAALHNPTTVDADHRFAGKVELVEAQDSDFNDAEDADGKRLYQFETIPGGTYGNSLQTGIASGVDTLAWNAAVYIRKSAFEDDEDALINFIDAVTKAAPSIIAAYSE